MGGCAAHRVPLHLDWDSIEQSGSQDIRIPMYNNPNHTLTAKAEYMFLGAHTEPHSTDVPCVLLDCPPSRLSVYRYDAKGSIGLVLGLSRIIAEELSNMERVGSAEPSRR